MWFGWRLCDDQVGVNSLGDHTCRGASKSPSLCLLFINEHPFIIFSAAFTFKSVLVLKIHHGLTLSPVRDETTRTVFGGLRKEAKEFGF